MSASTIKILDDDGNEEVLIPDLAVEFEKRYYELKAKKAEEKAKLKINATTAKEPQDEKQGDDGQVE